VPNIKHIYQKNKQKRKAIELIHTRRNKEKNPPAIKINMTTDGSF